MSWFASFKEKSLKIAQLYKNELSEFVTNLNEDVTRIIGGNEDPPKQDVEHTTNTIEPTHEEIKPPAPLKDYETLMTILQAYLTDTIVYDDFYSKVILVLEDPEKYIYPETMPWTFPGKENFSSFEGFKKQCNLTDEICEKIDTPTKDRYRKLVHHLLCSLIFLTEGTSRHTTPLKREVESEDEIIVSKEIVSSQDGDALEKKAEMSEQYVMVEDGSSSSHHSHSNDTERIESCGQRDTHNLSECDDWQVEERNFTMEEKS